MESTIKGTKSPTEGTLEEASTVGIDLRHHLLQGTKVEFYDCAGQVDYAGMHQTFLTRRALYLLLWDVTLFHGLDPRYLEKVGGSQFCRETMASCFTQVLSKTVKKHYYPFPGITQLLQLRQVRATQLYFNLQGCKPETDHIPFPRG